jgi:excisionase family DNA binding protein
MTKDVAAQYLSIGQRTFQELVSSGLIAGRRLGPRLIRYSRDELDEAVRSFPEGKGDRPNPE